MRDNRRRYRALRHALTHGSPGQPTGPVARPGPTLAALSSGRVGRKSPPRPSVATTIPAGPTPASRGQRVRRGRDHACLLAAGDLVPSVARVLPPCARETLGVGREGRGVGRGGLARRRQGGEKGRARPLAWRGRQRPSGHGPAARPSALLALRRPLMPEGPPGGGGGDGACEGTARQPPRSARGWSAGGRTARRATATGEGAPLRLEVGGAGSQPGRRMEGTAVERPRAQEGPSMGRWGGAKGAQEPLAMGSHLAPAEAACRWEHTRCRLATVCADQTSRGGQRPPSPSADPPRRSR
jgi:hypothetical protein